MNLFGGILNTARRLLFPQTAAQRAFGAVSAVSLTMEQHIALWAAMLANRPPWQTECVKPVGLPAAICREIAHTTLVELSASITGSSRAAYLAECFQSAQEQFSHALQTGLALGGVALKPFVSKDALLVDVTGAGGFQPTKFDPAGRCIGGVFKSKPVRAAGTYCVRLEAHDLSGTVYTVRNKVYYSDAAGTVGQEAPLTAVAEWADLAPEVTVENVTGPLFAYFRPPIANTADPSSPCGMSVYGDAATVELIRQADEQWERLRWEYKSGERKVLMDGTSSTAAMFDRRLFEVGPFAPDGKFFERIEPALRDEAMYRGFQNTLRRIEFNVGLSYGDISDPQTVEKTATEIRSSKQRKYVLISSIQSALEHAFDSLVYAMDVYASLYALAPAGTYQTLYNWGDSILDDQETREKEFARDLQLLSAGVMHDWEMRSKYFGEDEATAKAALPKVQQLVQEAQEETE